MATFSYEPPLPPVAPDAFIQTVYLVEEGTRIGAATWVIPDIDAGVLQILTMEIVPAHRRHGHGKRLLSEVLKQGNALCRSRKRKLRKSWMLMRHKGQVVGRSFLTGQSFHHVSTISHLLKDEDGLVYIRAFD
ncbi:MAG TPA: GNAT family N-acetyltransferase [Tepidisphaeraceae bacterium]|jgi:ribosomal protein S18 acetylase RimI-like enzyme|nr:GNAT family N-acetyltransferase [Tepidisphaeraceae bacterium]